MLRRVNFFDGSGYVILNRPYSNALLSADSSSADVIMTGADSIVMTLYKDENPQVFPTRVFKGRKGLCIEHGYFRLSEEKEPTTLLVPYEKKGYMLSFVSDGYYSQFDEYSLPDGRKGFIINFYDRVIAHLIVPAI